MKRLLLDQGLAPRAAVLLREREFNAIHVSKVGMERDDDAAILARAASKNRICVTPDHDFHAHLAIAGGGEPSVILLRDQGVDARGQADLIELIYGQCQTALQAGAAVSATRSTIRIRRLPLK